MNHLIFFAIQLLSLSPVWKVAHCQGWNMVFLIRVHWSRSRCWPAMAGSLIKKETTLVRTLAVTTPLITLKFHMVPSWHLHSPVQHLRKAHGRPRCERMSWQIPQVHGCHRSIPAISEGMGPRRAHAWTTDGDGGLPATKGTFMKSNSAVVVVQEDISLSRIHDSRNISWHHEDLIQHLLHELYHVAGLTCLQTTFPVFLKARYNLHAFLSCHLWVSEHRKWLESRG